MKSLKGKTYEEIYGIEKANILKLKRKLSTKNWHTSHGFDESTIQKMKNKQKELWDAGFYSKGERGEKISNFMKNHNPMKNPEIALKNSNNRRGKIDVCGEKNPAYKGIFHTKCLNCYTDISGSNWEIKKRKFCSSKCRHEYYSGENHPSKRSLQTVLEYRIILVWTNKSTRQIIK